MPYRDGKYLGEIARGNDIGKISNALYQWVRCPRCEKYRWVLYRRKVHKLAAEYYCNPCAAVGRSKRLRFD